MNRTQKSITTAVFCAATAAMLLTACDTDSDRDCDSVVMFYSSTDHHYHYGSATGRTVPAYKVPSSARKAPGYKPVGPAKPPSVSKPKSFSKPRTGRR